MKKQKNKKLIVLDAAYQSDSGNLSSDLTIFKESQKKPIGWLWVWTIEDLLRLEGCSHDRHSYNIKKCDKPKKIVAGFGKEKHDQHYDYCAVFNTKQITIKEYVGAMRQWCAAENFEDYDIEFKTTFLSNDWQKKNLKDYGYEIVYKSTITDERYGLKKED